MTEHNYEQMRRAMVAGTLRTTGVNDPRVLAAMGDVPRERFVPEPNRAIAYADTIVPLGNGRYLNSPMALGKLLVEAAPRESERALVVGAATGYAAAVMARLVGEVVAVEEEPELAAAARAALAGSGVKLVEGALAKGYKRGAPYDMILIDGAVEIIPDPLVDQLADGGRSLPPLWKMAFSVWLSAVGQGEDSGWSHSPTSRLRRCRASKVRGDSLFEDGALRASKRIGRASWLAAVGGGALLAAQPVPAETLQDAMTKADSSSSQAAPGQPGRTETLRDALVKAYNSNPTLTSQRAQLRSIDEGVPIARSQSRPQILGDLGLNQDLARTGIAQGRNFTAGVDLSLPLYAGGGVKNSISAAKARVEAGRADLRAVEGDIFVEAVAAYMDVIRDRSIVALNENQVKVLETNLQATRDRFEVGDLTRTDVAQSEARLSLARSGLATARGQLTASEENYRRVIGSWPGDLEPPPPLPPLPGTAEQAVDVALANNADLRSIDEQIRAAGLDVRVARADRLPAVSGITGARYTNFLGTEDEQFGPGANGSTNSVGAGMQARIPLYQGGLVGARVRQSQAIQSRLLEQGIAVERSVVALARSAFAAYQASLQAIESNQTAVEANTLALEGTKAEQSVGTRNVLDVLNAEQELLNSQVELVRARRNAYVAGFQLLNAMGQAEARDLNLEAGPLYDPSANYRRVAGKINDWDDDPSPQPVATRTVGPPAPPPPGSKEP